MAAFVQIELCGYLRRGHRRSPSTVKSSSSMAESKVFEAKNPIPTSMMRPGVNVVLISGPLLNVSGCAACDEESGVTGRLGQWRSHRGHGPASPRARWAPFPRVRLAQRSWFGRPRGAPDQVLPALQG